MNAGKRARFDIETLRKLAGDRSFARGKDYFRDGCVQILSLGSKRVVAEVSGTEDYRTVLTGRGEDIDGECSCPAFEDQGFCKHMVATALAANAAGDGAEGEANAALSRIREHLKAKPRDQLVDIILDLAEEDAELFRKLDLDSAIVGADDATLEKRLQKAIDAATRIRTYVDYRAARDWSAGVEAALDAVADIARGPRANVALRLAEHAIELIGKAFESIDDSDGHLGSLLGQAHDIHLAAAEAARPEAVALARSLFKREMEDDPGAFGNLVVDYADVLGKPGLAEYRRLAEAAWKKVPARSGRVRAADDDSGSVHQLMNILDFFAERDGDVESRIALRMKNLSSQWDYLQLAEFCLSQGRKEEALRRAEEGLWQFEDDRLDERLLFLVAKLLTKARRKTDAEAHLWRAFQKAPSLNVYKELRSAGGEAAAARALAFLESGLGDNKRPWWRNRPDLLVEILMLEKRFDAAWSIARKFGASEYAMQRLVAATDIDFPREAIEFYAAQIERFATAAAYSEAVRLIGRMAKLRSPAEHEAFVADLKLRHGRKRSFMKLLGQKA
jgi:tetratricopeptide (TPR) repeat protein